MQRQVDFDGESWEATLAGAAGGTRERGRKVIFRRRGSGSFVLVGEVRDVTSIHELTSDELREALERALGEEEAPGSAE